MQTRATGGLPKGFLQPCLLLLLREEADYGYGLAARLRPLGIDDDAATVYRALRGLEAVQAVESCWETGGSGPARRVYSLTRDGETMLDDWGRALEATATALSGYLARYARVRGLTTAESTIAGISAPEDGAPPEEVARLHPSATRRGGGR